jgi:L-iditol 2-dehydrogenase
MPDLIEALRYAKDRVEDAIKVVVKNDHAVARRAVAAE